MTAAEIEDRTVVGKAVLVPYGGPRNPGSPGPAIKQTGKKWRLGL